MPPEGMWFSVRNGAKKPFVARWREASGEKKSRSFESAPDRKDFAEAWDKRRKEFGRTATMASPKDVGIWEEFSQITGGANPIEVAQFWAKFHEKAEGKITLSEVIKKFEETEKKRIYSRDTSSHQKLHLERLLGFIGDKPLALIGHQMIINWLDSMETMSPQTKKHHRKSANKVFSYAVATRLLNHNPMDAVPVPQVIETEAVNILSIDQARELFTANRDALCIGRLALEAFGGLRVTSAARLKREDINFEEAGIIFPGPKHKSGRRHYVDGFPLNLWKWIWHAPDACWDISERQYFELKRKAFEKAGLKPDIGPGEAATESQKEEMDAFRNALRHSFATYHLAANKDAAKTAVLMTHRNVTTLYKHYAGRASKADADKYFDIVP